MKICNFTELSRDKNMLMQYRLYVLQKHVKLGCSCDSKLQSALLCNTGYTYCIIMQNEVAMLISDCKMRYYAVQIIRIA